MTENFFRENHFASDFFGENHIYGGVPAPPGPGCGDYFGSFQFASNFFASNHFAAVCHPVPPNPPRTFFAGGGVGGGKTVYLEELPPGIWGPDPKKATYAQVLAKKIRSKSYPDGLKTQDPLKTKKVPQEYGLKQTIHELKEQIASLQDALARANAQTMIPWKLLQNAMAEIERLKSSVAHAEAEQVRTSALVEEQRRMIAELQERTVQADPEAGIQWNIDPASVFALTPFEAVLARTMGAIEPSTVPAPATPFPWAEAAAAAAGFLITAKAIPESWTGARAFGYAASTALLMAALKRLLFPKA